MPKSSTGVKDFQNILGQSSEIQTIKNVIQVLTVQVFTLLPPGEGAGRGAFWHTIRLSARPLEPFHLRFPKFLNFFNTLWTHFGEISGKLIFRGGGGAEVIFRTRGHEKLGKLNFLFSFKMA